MRQAISCNVIKCFSDVDASFGNNQKYSIGRYVFSDNSFPSVKMTCRLYIAGIIDDTLGSFPGTLSIDDVEKVLISFSTREIRKLANKREYCLFEMWYWPKGEYDILLKGMRRI